MKRGIRYKTKDGKGKVELRKGDGAIIVTSYKNGESVHYIYELYTRHLIEFVLNNVKKLEAYYD